jgi:streptogramin lyase
LAFVGGCGGGSAGGPASGPGVGLPPVSATNTPSPTPPAQTIGDVHTLATIPHGEPITYDPDDRTLLYAGINPDYSSSVFSLAPARYGYHCAGSISALHFDAAHHVLYIACGTTIYSQTAGGAAATFASGFQSVYSMTTDASGKLYVIDNDHVASVRNGSAAALTGSLFGLPYTDPEVTVQVPQLTFDTMDGALYATDPVNDVVDRITTAGSVSTIAGKCYWYTAGGPGACFLSNVAGTGSAAVFGTPSGIAYDPTNNLLYMSDAWNNNVWTITPSGTAVQVAGYGGYGPVDGNGLSAFIPFPYALAFDVQSGLLYMRTWYAQFQYIESYATTGAPPPAYTEPVKRFMLPSYTYGAGEMAVSPDGSAWTSEQLANKVAHIDASGNIHEYPMPAPWSQPWRIVVDKSGNAWVGVNDPGPAGTRGAALVRVDDGGNTTVFPLAVANTGGDTINALSLDGGGNVWFTKANAYGGSVGYVTPAGAINEFSVGSTFNAPRPQALAPGPDGMMWFSYSSGTIGRVSASGQFATPITPSANVSIARMVANPAQNDLWFTDEQTTVGTITAGGTVSTFSGFYIDRGDADPTQMAVDSSGNIWLSEENFSDVARVDAGGNITRYIMPQANPGISGVAARSDGKIWVGSNMGAIFLLDPAAYAAARLPQSAPRKRTSSARW